MCDITTLSNAECNRPKIEMVTWVTNHQSKNLCMASNYATFNLSEDLMAADFWKFIGTSLTSETSSKFEMSSYELVGFFNDEYDLSISLPIVSITKKVRVKSVSKFTPKVIL